MNAREMRTWLDALVLAETRLQERLDALPADPARRSLAEARQFMQLTAMLDVLRTGGTDGIGAGHHLADALHAANVEAPPRPGGAWWPLRLARRKLDSLEGTVATEATA